MEKKYMILCVAGQSNAVGFDESRIPEDYLGHFRTERIRQLGLYGEDNLKIVPLAIRKILLQCPAPGGCTCLWQTFCWI